MNSNLARIVDLPELSIPDSKLAHFYDRIKHEPETTFGNVKADALAEGSAPHPWQFLQRHVRTAWAVNLSASSNRKFKH